MASAVPEKDNIWRDQFSDNLQDQRDEVLALQSIFNTDEFEKLKVLTEISDDKEGLFTLLVTICPKPNDEDIQVEVAVAVTEDELEGAAAAPVVVNPPRMPVPLDRSLSGRNWQGSLSVKYLAPLYLQMTFPPSYPSLDPPNLHLSCDWMSPLQISCLCSMLKDQWEEAGEMPIVFIWIDALENNCLSHLGITNHISLKPWKLNDTGEEMGEDEMDALQGVMEAEELGAILARIIRYNREQLHIDFCQMRHECNICFDEKPGTQFFIMSDCDHYFCHECMANLCDLHVTAGTVEHMRCPDTSDCNAVVPPYVVQAVLGPEAFARWEQLLLQKTLDAMQDTVYCPRCGSLVISEGDEDLARCPACFFSFCTQCHRSWHQGQRCETDDEVLEKAEKKDRNNMNDKERRKYDEIMRKLRQDFEDSVHVKKLSKKCPHCKIPIEKTGGCNKMACKCGKSFCWMCLKIVVSYDHFRQSNCVLFPGQNDPPPGGPLRRPPNENLLRMRVQIEINPELRNNQAPCPSCRQLNLKGLDRNNHLKCWNCKTKFCYCCRQMFHSPMVHFKAGGCLQHS